VCPAPFPCGEARRAVLVSAPEGDDKPEKYPALFASADLLVVTKADLLPHVEFDVARCVASARAVRPGLPYLLVSARTGLGIENWLAWVQEGRV
jgi:hydrogenase nickel incorporation protein HypB